MSRIEGKAAFVTGANRGMGRAFVEELNLPTSWARVGGGSNATDNL